jgi:RND family efflux transporter MFP subunit
MAQTTTPTLKPSRQNPPGLPAHEQDGGGSNAPDQHAGNGHGEAHPGEGIPHDLKTPSTGAVIIAVSGFVVLLVILFFVGWIPSYREKQAAYNDAVERANALPVVSYATPAISTGSHDVVLPCDVKANQQTAIFTRTNGYLKKWNFDIGQHVEAGQLMAEIDTPEVDAELAQSQASLKQNEAAVKKAEADKDLAQTTLDRYVDANNKSPGSVTKEAIDQNISALKDADAALNQAIANVAAAQANVQQLTTQVGFEKVYAPFSGTVTARNYDVGALLSPTNTAAGSEIFDLAQTDPLRVFVNVPQEYANDVKLNEHAKLFVRNFANRSFDGVVTLTAGAVDPTTRTLSVQIDFPNKDGTLFSGEYGEIHLPVHDPEPVGLISTSALIFNAQTQGLQVAMVTDLKHDDEKKRDLGIVHMTSIKTGRDFGTTIEVTSGLNPQDMVVTNPSERVLEGAKVQAVPAPHDGVTSVAPTTKPAAAP